MSASLLAFDVGTRWVGVAVGSALSGARPLQTLPADDRALWSGIDKLLATWQPQGCVVGLPLALDGSDQPMTRVARAFAARLQTHVGQVVLIDERHSSQDAQAQFRSGRNAGALRRKDSQNLDAIAAALILERYLQTIAC